jgi:flagellar motor protein MotB
MSDDHKNAHGQAGGEAHGEEGHEKGHKGHGGGGHGHGGGGHEEHAGAPEWLISFADNVALLMGFFVILLAMNMNKPKAAHGLGGAENKDELNELIYGIRQAFNSLPSLESKDPKDGPLVDYMKRRSSRGETSSDGAPGLATTQQAIRPSDFNNVTASFPFDVNATTLAESGKQLARDVAGRLRGQAYVIEVRGHVSAVEAAAGQEAALRLSFQRATAVANALAENGVRWSNLRLAACSDHDRKSAIAYDAAGHRTNQRAEIVITNETVSADPHVKEGGGQ